MVEASESGNVYQYIRMELCDGGDLEDFIRDQANQTLPLHEAVVPYLFQMVFAIYAARDKYQLRHFDIKLLNFFLKKVPSEHLDAVYAFGSDCYQIQLDKPYACWVKLADYGTAETQAETLGKPIALEQVRRRSVCDPIEALTARVVYNIREYPDRILYGRRRCASSLCL